MIKVSFEEVGSVMATFLCGEDVQEGAAVAMGGDGTVGVCAVGKRPCGVAVCVGGDGCVGVQVRGAAAVGYSGADLTAGWEKLVGDGDGRVKKDAVGTEMLILSVDTVGKVAVVLL